jgi:crossover junction endodeoxyribonuclease RuvC
MQNKAEVILGIDPGTNIMGFGCIYGSGDQWKCIDAGILQLEKKLTAFEKLNSIYHKCTELLQDHKPDSVAIEAPFYGKNVQSMLKLGRAQGVCIAAVTSKGHID